MVVLNLVTASTHAAEVVRFFGPLVSPAQLQVLEYLGTGDAAALETVRLVGLKDVRFVFAKALERLANADASLEDRTRARTILQMRVVTDPGEKVTTAGLNHAKDLSNRLLHLLPVTDFTQTRLLLHMSRFDLWTGQQAWFLTEKASTVEGLRAFHEILGLVIPELSERQLDELELALRDIEPRHKLQLAVLDEIGRLQEDDILTLLDIASLDFARTLSRGHADPEGRSMITNYEDWVSVDNQRFAGLLQHVKWRLGLDDAETTRAFRFAKRKAAASTTHTETRLAFFDALQTDLFDWLDRERWFGARAKPALGPGPETTAEVIEGRFGTRRQPNCGENLEN